MLDRLSDRAPQSLAVLRIVAALLFIHAGIQLLFGIPAPTYPPPPPEMATLQLVAGLLELVGGLLILVGFLTRPAAFVLSGMMAVACWGFHAPINPFPVNNMGTAAILFCFVFLHLVFAGPGSWSVDGAASRPSESLTAGGSHDEAGSGILDVARRLRRRPAGRRRPADGARRRAAA